MKILGIGSEIVESLRVARMIERHGELFINRIFTTAEVRFCNRSPATTQQFAGRWAAKEAVLRAVGIRSRKDFDYKSLEIRRGKDDRLTVAFRGPMLDAIEQMNVGEIHLTIAHCRAVATATAIALSRSSRRKKPKAKKKKK